MAFETTHSRREFLRHAAGAAAGLTLAPLLARAAAADPAKLPAQALKFPGPWRFQFPKGSIILVSDDQLEDLQDPDKPVDLSLSSAKNLTTLRKVCEQTRAAGGETLILAFDEFWTQYRPGQGGKPRRWTPDMDEYIQRLGAISRTVKEHGLGLELSLLSPLEIGRGFTAKTGESGRWVQYREGYRDPATGKYTVSLWEQRRWTNNKGTIELERKSVRVFAFREQRIDLTSFYTVNPADIVELKTAPEIDVDESDQTNTHARRLTLRGAGEKEIGPLDCVLVVVTYATPEMDYFSPQAAPFLQDLVERYHAAGIPLNGLYADEMHIQQDWGYGTHHDEGQFTFRYLTPHLAARFAELYGAEFADLEKYLVYFCYAQHGFRPDVQARLPAQHVLGAEPDDIQRTYLLRRRYYDLLEQGVVDLFARAKEFAEKKYGRALEARAHATWAQSPTCDLRNTEGLPVNPRQYEYTPDFLWSNTVQQSAAACSDYFAWNDFLTGGGNDHAEGGWADRNYYGIALACSTGILNRTPYAYAAAWGMPRQVLERHQAVCDAFGAAARPWFQAVEDSQHRDTDVLMLYPMSLVACEERFGSWMVQYAGANYVTPRKLLQHGRVLPGGQIEMAGRRFGTLAVLFEPLPPAGLLDFLARFAEAGGKLVWSGPPPRIDFAGQPALAAWAKLFGVKNPPSGRQGQIAGGQTVEFNGRFKHIPAQTILTDFLVDRIYPVRPMPDTEVVASVGRKTVGLRRALPTGGSATFLGFRPRDDQSASLGHDVATWFDILMALDAYPKIGRKAATNDNPDALSRKSSYAACRFPNGTTAIAAHYRTYEETWPGGFHRDAKQDDEILTRNPLPSGALTLKDWAVNGHKVTYDGDLVMAFRLDARGALAAFAGHGARRIIVDGREHVFASQPMPLVAWAPVAAERQVEGGAILELWVHGEADVTIPLPSDLKHGRLYFAAGPPGSLGDKVESVCEKGRLKFKAAAAWGHRHLFLLPD